MATLAEIRAKLIAQDRNTGSGNRDHTIFAHWNIPDNSTTTLRFLPDGNNGNDFFWKERQMIKIPFSGVKGDDESKAVIVQVPCIEMWGDKCPIHAEIRPWFKDPNMEDMARKYWKKRSYIFQGFVVDTQATEDETPDNPIRRFTISPQIQKIIQAALMDPDFGDELPTDYEKGIDFKITKTQNGQYADYSTSNWSRKERSLNQDERDAIEEHGLFDLNDFMPKRPDEKTVEAIFQMFEASVEGQLYDPERFGEFYKPFGLDIPKSNGNSSSDNDVKEPVKELAAGPVKEPETSTADTPESDNASKGKDAKDILAAIRARKS